MDDFFCFTNISDMLGKKRVALREREREEPIDTICVCNTTLSNVGVSGTK